MPNLTAVELCCGMGGIGLGLTAAGFTVQRALDSWDESVAVYNYNAPRPVARVCDLLKEGHRTLRQLRRQLGEVDLLAAGPPCKGFTQLNNAYRKPNNPHNRLLLAIPEFVAIMRPRRVLIENVPHLRIHRNGSTFAKLIQLLERPASKGLRYTIQQGVYDSAQFGVPQSRRRLIIVATRADCSSGTLPPSHSEGYNFSVHLRRGLRASRAVVPARPETDCIAFGAITTTRDALSDLPRLGPGRPEAPRKYVCGARNAFQSRMRSNAFETVANTRTPKIKPETLKRLIHIGPGECLLDLPPHRRRGMSRSYYSAYRRLHPEAPSTVLATRHDCAYHYKQNRLLSVREYARLQGIEDRVVFPRGIPARSAYEMIGNAVPPLLIEAIVRKILAEQ